MESGRIETKRLVYSSIDCKHLRYLGSDLYSLCFKERRREAKQLNTRRRDRVVECTGLENQSVRKGTGGSNPPASALCDKFEPVENNLY